MRNLRMLSLLVLLLTTQLVWSQNRTITGKVTEANGTTPVPNATISVNGRAASIANATGEFSVVVPANVRTLQISAIGFNDQDVVISGTSISVLMVPGENKTISEVVVTGYSTIQRKKFAGSIANISTEEVKRQPFGSFDQALQGQAAGVSVIANSGQPGANAVVRIRGNGSITGNNVPLYIVDGIEINAADFASMNQGDFDRVEILKDAVATGQYGSRGANGVIVITTRRGRAGQLQFSYDAQVGFSKLPEDRLVVMNSQEKIDYELQRGNPYGWTPAEADSLRNVNFNWRDALFETGVTQQHQISVSGGSQTSRLYASLSYMDQEGIVKTTGLKRYTARVNVDNNIKNWRFGVGLQGGFSKRNNTAEANTFLSTPLNAIRWSNPYERDIDPRTGDYQETGGAGTGQLTSTQPNGAMELFLNYNFTNQIKAIATSYIEFHLPAVKGLYFRTNWGIDYTQNEVAGYTSPRTTTGIARQGALNRTFGRNLRYTGTTSLNYKKDIGDHEFEGGVFFEVVKSDFRNFGFTGYGFTNGFDNESGISAGSTTNPQYIPIVGGNGTQNGLQSFFSILSYGYKGKYYLNLVGRRDGSSRLGLENRYANFGSVGFTWAMSQESFMDNVNFVNDLKFRASYGTTGNEQPPGGDYANIPLFARTTYAGVAGWSPDPANPGNLELVWETNRTANIGVDFSLLNRRLSGSIDVYDRTTKSLFYSIPTDPAAAGLISIPSNFGTLKNSGIEILLRGDVVKTQNFRWEIGGNLTYNKNRVTELIQDSAINGLTILAKGKPLNSLYLVEYAGVNPDNGNAMYVKRDKSTTAAYSVNDKVIWGTSDAPWFGGINTTVEYKGFDLSANMVFFLDRYLYNNDRNNLTNPGYFYDNMHVLILTEWRNPGDITDVPRPSAGTLGGTAPANPYQAQTTRFLEDASFWRLRNITLGYNFKTSLLGKANIRSARLFIQGQNLWTSTKYQSFDPEMTGTQLVGAQYPALKQTTIGLSIGF